MPQKISILIKKSKTFYQSIKPVLSKSLKQTVVFNRYGWKHLLYDSSDRRRNNKCIELRLFLLPEARQIIQNSNFPAFPSITTDPQTKKQIKYFEILGKSKKTKKGIKVIVRQINEGNYHYFSIRRSKR